jgi:hypothetical protein
LPVNTPHISIFLALGSLASTMIIMFDFTVPCELLGVTPNTLDRSTVPNTKLDGFQIIKQQQIM